jgi:prophage maintenance system killer protein
MELRTISTEEIIQIHESLVQDFACSDNPLEPPGIRSLPLLQSAVSRQFTSIGGICKYPEALGNAATLAYGLCNDHPFHNGNKRTALVSMLVH